MPCYSLQRRSLAARLRCERAMTLIEVLAATLVLAIGTVGLMSAFTAGRSSTSYAELHSLAIQYGERELQRVTSLEWSAISLSSATTWKISTEATDPTSYLKNEECDAGTTLPQHGPPCYQYNWSKSTALEPLVLEAAGTADATADPTSFETTNPSGSTRLAVKIYRYITWVVDPECKGTGSSCATTSSVSSEKRVTVAVTVGGLKKPVVLSTLMNDTDHGEAHPLGEAKCSEACA